MRNIITLLIMVFLFGCNAAYQRPDSPDVAHVRFLPLQEQGYHSLVAAYAHNGDTCSGAKKIMQIGGFEFGGTDFSKADLGMLKDPKIPYKRGDFFETTVSTSESFHFTVAASASASGLQHSECYITSSFMPVQGAQYEVSYYTGATKCYLQIDRISLEKERFQRTRESSTVQREKACTFFWN